MTHASRLGLLAVVVLLGGCATVTGPSVMTLPGTGKSFDEFRADDATCRQFAAVQAGLTPQEAAAGSTATGAAVGTAIGAAAGALLGGTGSAAGIGAGAGLLMGSLIGASYGTGSYWNAQSRYDAGFMQCMYAKGNKIPVSARFASTRTSTAAVPPQAAAPQPFYPPPPGAPPPPPGTPPPPPPR